MPAAAGVGIVDVGTGTPGTDSRQAVPVPCAQPDTYPRTGACSTA